MSLCAIKSVTGHEKAFADALEKWGRNHFAARELRRLGHSLMLGRLSDPRPTLLLVGHTDTVPPHPGDRPPRRAGARVHGLGASDMKGAIAVMQALVEDLDLEALPYNLALLFYEREEGPYAENGLGPMLKRFPELKGAALAICMEPTDNEVQVGCVGGLHATVTFRGRSAHSARPWQGENAIHKAGAFLSRLHRLRRRRVRFNGLEYFEVFSATVANGGRARNVVPDHFCVNLNYRFAPGKSLGRAEAELSRLVGDQAEVEIIDRSPAGRLCLGNRHYQRLLAASGRPPKSKQAWTDVARLAEQGIDAVNYGPGLTAQAHQKDEFVPIRNLEHIYRKLKAFLSKG